MPIIFNFMILAADVPLLKQCRDMLAAMASAFVPHAGRFMYTIIIAEIESQRHTPH